MSKRSSIPTKLKRDVEVEAGHRCAIPTCREHPCDIHHIIPYAKCQKHSFDNLIALCTNCHARYHRNKEIDCQSLKIYKLNLRLVNKKYSHFEMRVLQHFIENANTHEIKLWERELDILYLIKDGLLQKKTIQVANANGIGFLPSLYVLTEQGKIFIQKWVCNKSLI